MAPRGARRSEALEGEDAFFDFGKRGRKTGTYLKDTGARDEHGMQPLEDLLSSPERVQPLGPSDDESDDQGSEDMDIETDVGPGPRTLLKDRSVQHPLPRSRSPIRTQLQSPARRNPRLSSPVAQDPAQERGPKVTRKLDFNSKPQLSGKGRSGANGINGDVSEEDGDETEDAEEHELDDMDLLEQSMQMVQGMDRSTTSPEPERDPYPEEEEPELLPPKPSAKARRHAKTKPVEKEPSDEPVPEESEPEPEESEPEPEKVEPRPKNKGGRPRKNQDVPQEAEAGPKSRKRSAPRQDAEPDNDTDSANLPKTKRQRTTEAKGTNTAKTAPSKTASKAKSNPVGKRGRQRKDTGADAGETSFAALQRGPPMPRSRGLVSVRRDPDVMSTTRSGRHSYRPLDYWRGEQAIQEEHEFEGASAHDRFVLPTIKEIIRVPEEETRPRGGPKGKSRGKGQAKRAQKVEEELEEWEISPGTITGEVILWEPEHELHPPADDEPVEVMEDRVAISAEAVQTREIRDATFRFAKTLTTPFMGAGVVDLPPGAEKRPKNSRKMHMVFFVHTGKVMVTVNEAQFRITAGGMWFVPRGNYYSITNDYDNPARIFFSQGCEISAQPPDIDQSQQSVLA